MSVFVLIWGELRNDEKSMGDVAILKGESYDLRDNGKVSVRRKHWPIESRVRFAFAKFEAALESDSALDVSGEGWSSFREAVEVRNRLTHPTYVADLTVSHQEVALVEKAHEWFKGSFQEVLR